MTPLRILVVEPNLDDNGAMRSSIALAERWRLAGHDVRMLIVDAVAGRDAGVPVPAGLNVLLSDAPQRLRYRLPAMVARAARAARDADLVVAGREVGWGILVAAAAAPVARRPFVTFVRAEPRLAVPAHAPGGTAGLTFRALGSARIAICVSSGLARSVETLTRPPASVRAITHGLDVAGVRARGAEPLTGPAPEGPVILGVGRLSFEKGFDLLLRAHAQLLARGVRQRVLILGEGQDRASLEALTEELGVGDTVTFAGFVQNPMPHIAAADVVCAPSRWEGFNTVLAEALALGAPVIAADCPHGPRDVLDGGRYGALVPVDDVEALTAALGAHLAAPGDLRRRAAEGAETTPARFDLDREAALTAETFAEAVRAPSARRARPG